uniref:PDZ_6 domain-containing protein n=1 Tax=Meloidogyne hapla TaxID=6305 RepID=A0A1I8BC03_MELHA
MTSNVDQCYYVVQCQRYVVEETIQVVVADEKIGVTFYEGKIPNRVARIRYDSCFIGQLLAGDVILSVDGQAITSGEDFTAICSRGQLPRSVTVKFRRDNYYKIQTIKRTELKTKRGESQGIYIQARWRPDLPLGMIVENKATFLRITRDFVRILFDFKDDAVVVVQVEPGSAAFQHFQYGDVLEKGEKRKHKINRKAKIPLFFSERRGGDEHRCSEEGNPRKHPEQALGHTEGHPQRQEEEPD